MSKKMILSKRELAFAVVALGALQSQAIGATDTATLTALATVSAQCFVDDATLAFGTFGIFNAGATAATSPTYTTADASAAVPIVCTDGTTAKVYAAAASIALTGTAATLTAAIASNAAGGTAFPTTSAGGIAVTGNGGATAQTTPVYGRIITDATTKTGTYSGTVGLTIDYTP